MSQSHQIRSYDYVNFPYASVRDLLRADADRVLSAATSGAPLSDRASFPP